MKKRVVITGMGIISPIGTGLEVYWDSLKNGRHGFGRITSLDASPFPCQIAAEVKDFVPENHIDRKKARRMDRFTQFAVAAGESDTTARSRGY